MGKSLKDLENHIKKLQKFVNNDATRIIETEGTNHFKESFENQGFTDRSLSKWKPRKTVDNRGRDLTRYRTDRVGRRGELNAFGRRNKGRDILTGHNTGADKLRNSLHSKRYRKKVVWTTYKEYARYHNEGSKHLPKRQFMGRSTVLNQNIKRKFKRTLAEKYGFNK